MINSHFRLKLEYGNERLSVENIDLFNITPQKNNSLDDKLKKYGTNLNHYQNNTFNNSNN